MASLLLGWSHRQALKADHNFYVGSERGFILFDLKVYPNPHKSAVRIEREVLFVTYLLAPACMVLFINKTLNCLWKQFLIFIFFSVYKNGQLNVK